MIVSHYFQIFLILLCIGGQSYAMENRNKLKRKVSELNDDKAEKKICLFCDRVLNASENQSRHVAYHWNVIYRKILEYIQNDESEDSQESLELLFKTIDRLSKVKKTSISVTKKILIKKVPHERTAQALLRENNDCLFCDKKRNNFKQDNGYKDHLGGHCKYIMINYFQLSLSHKKLYAFLRKLHNSDFNTSFLSRYTQFSEKNKISVEFEEFMNSYYGKGERWKKTIINEMELHSDVKTDKVSGIQNSSEIKNWFLVESDKEDFDTLLGVSLASNNQYNNHNDNTNDNNIKSLVKSFFA